MNGILSDFVYSINVILPILLLILLGAVLKRFGFVTDAFCSVADKLIFKIALPAMLFLDVATASVSGAPEMSLLVFILVSVTAVFLLSSLIVPIFVKDRAKCGAFVQAICRSNFAILGIPLLNGMFGEAGSLAAAVVIPPVILMFNTYSVIVLSVFAPKEKQLTPVQLCKKVVVNVITNPLIIAVLLGLPFMLLGWKLPLTVSKTAGYLDGLVTPLALISLGASTSAKDIRGNFRLAAIATGIKTVLFPAIACTVGAFIGLRGVSLGILLILFGAPTAVSSYIMAKNMGSDESLAGQILLFTTSVCVFTVFIGIFILKRLCLI